MSGKPTINEMARMIRDELRNVVFPMPVAGGETPPPQATPCRIAEVEAITFSGGDPIYRVRCTNGEAYNVRVRVNIAEGETTMGEATSSGTGYDIIPVAKAESAGPGRSGPQEPA